MDRLKPFLSAKGRAIAWPKEGILQQTAEAKGCAIDATVGAAIAENGEPMRLSPMEGRLPAKETFPYAPAFGLPALRAAWEEGLRRKDPSLKTCSSPVVTAGITHGLAILSHLFVDENDPVILPELFWGNYKLLFAHNVGATIVTHAFFDKERFNLAAFTEAISCRKKMILLLNFPNNPTGYSPTEQEAAAIVSALTEAAEKGSTLIVILDDAYHGLVHESNIRERSLFADLATAHERILVAKADGATKEEFAWGFRIAFLTYAGKGLTGDDLSLLEEKTAAVTRASVSSCNLQAQHLILRTLNDPKHDEEKQKNISILKRRYEKAKELIKKLGLDALPFNSGYFLCLKVKDAESARQRLLTEGVGVISLPGNLLRVAYSNVPTEKLDELFERIAAAIRSP